MMALRSSVSAPRLARAAAPVRSIRMPVNAVLKAAQKSKTTKVEAPKKQTGLQLGFTKDNELFVGRAAMMGFAFSLIGEVLTGKGALGQLGYEVFNDKLGIVQIDELIVGLIAFNLIAALLPASGTFVPDEEVEQRPAGALQDPRVSILEPKKFFGVTGFGFTKENELFVGRVAQLGFAASLIGETYTGKGPLEQLNIETGIPLIDIDFGLGVFILFFLFAAVNPGTGRFVNELRNRN